MPTAFQLPTTPDEFSVTLVQPEARKLDFSSLDFSTVQRAVIEYIKTYHSDNFNDYVASNGIMMLTEIVSSLCAKLALRGDLLHQESYFPTCRTELAAVNHLALIGQKIKRQTPANTDIEVTVTNPVAIQIDVPAGTVFTVNGPDGNQITYEAFRAPDDFTSSISIPAGKRGVIAFGLEGKFEDTVTAVSPGGARQTFTVNNANILESPVLVTVTSGNESQQWLVTQEALELFGPTDKVVHVDFYSDSAVFTFGDDINGASPLAGQTINIRYRTGGGIRGRIGTGIINESRMIYPGQAGQANASAAPVDVRFRNITPSTGGTDAETLDVVKRRAPREFARHDNIVTNQDYISASTSYTHPVYGAVSKALATVRTDVNANLIEIYVLAEGTGNIPVAPSTGLKIGLKTYLESLNPLTDQVEILDGKVKLINLDATVVISKNSDASIVKTNVENAITSLFDITNWMIGQPLYMSDIVKAVQSIEGVLYVNIYDPQFNILRRNEIGPLTDGIGFNELIVLGSRNVRYLYENTSLRN